MLTPAHFGLPSKFDRWRPNQLDAVNQILESPSRFVVVCAPTGFGKSLVYMAAAKMGNKRTAILTSTKGLQDQLQSDFGSMEEYADIRGQSSYRCPIATQLGYSQFTVVADAPCKGGYPCLLRGAGCEYFDRYRRAQSSRILVTNYACWLYDSMREDKLDAKFPFDMVVLDEAHDAPEQLSSFLSTEIERAECVPLNVKWPVPKEMKIEDWKAWAREWSVRAEKEEEIHRKDGDYRKSQKWKKLWRKLGRVARMSDDWIVEAKHTSRGTDYERPVDRDKAQTNPTHVRFDPLLPAPYAESTLFRNIKKVVLVSATVRPKTAQLLGITGTASTPTSSIGLGSKLSVPDLTNLDFREYPSSFPIHSRPIIHVPTVQMSFRNTEMELGWWISKIDQIIDGRLDRKGIIHTVSYSRAKMIYENSRHSSRLLLHDSASARTVIERFKSSSSSCVLVSPSVSTGYDFPYKECEYQIICKLPFPDSRDSIIKARTKTDKDYTNYITMQTLVQSVGRGMRAEDDRCETLIIDDNVSWFMGQNGSKFAPRWFKEAYSTSTTVPRSLVKL